jgi:hypothetical protein
MIVLMEIIIFNHQLIDLLMLYILNLLTPCLFINSMIYQNHRVHHVIIFNDIVMVYRIYLIYFIYHFYYIIINLYNVYYTNSSIY